MNEGKPFFGEIRQSLEAHKEEIIKLKIHENTRIEEQRTWPIYDAPLLEEQRTDNMPISFENDFGQLIPERIGNLEHLNLKQYIEKVLENRRGKALGIEFGGPGRRLFSGFTPGFFAKTAGVALNDMQKTKYLTQDKTHQIIEGDFFTTGTRNEVRQYFQGEKVDLIIERMAGGLNYLPKDPRLVFYQFAWWYNILREGGLMFVELPADAEYIWKQDGNTVLKNWLEKLKEFEDQIEIQSGDLAIRLLKLPGAPEEMPMI
jgi:hypothetical protein